eukprot:452397-Rhodomonas_salina.1
MPFQTRTRDRVADAPSLSNSRLSRRPIPPAVRLPLFTLLLFSASVSFLRRISDLPSPPPPAGALLLRLLPAARARGVVHVLPRDPAHHLHGLAVRHRGRDVGAAQGGDLHLGRRPRSHPPHLARHRPRRLLPRPP